MFKYTLSNESVMVVVDGVAHTVRKGVPNFVQLVTALLSDDDAAVRANLTVKNSLEAWAKGKFTVDGDTVKYMGDVLPPILNKRMVEMATKGESPESLFNFWDKLQANPSKRSVDQLWTFLEHCGIPLAPDGDFLAYKGVRDDLTDQYSGKLDNTPGKVQTMARNQISDDPRTPCHEGLHVGALSYASGFGPTTIIVKVNPADVVCVPYDESARKMRVCRYEVIGFHGSQLSDTTHEDENDPEFTSDEGMVDDLALTDESEEGGLVDEATVSANLKKVTQKDKYADFGKLQTKDLLRCSIAELREYAGKGLQIVGASKIPGGKTSLIKRILTVRGKRK